MQGLRGWLADRFSERPWWMNAVMVFCAFLTFVYMPWDFFIKPVAVDEEAWFGLLLRGWAAKLTEPIHWAIYAAGLYGLWNMRPWMWPWAAVYVNTVAFGMFLWPILYIGGFGGVLLGLVSAIPLLWLTRAFWRSADLFTPRDRALRERYGEWAIVTGASAGIGAEFARALARDGLSIVLVARREDRLRALASELESVSSVSARIVAVDLTEPDAVARIERAVEGLDVGVLVNNAGVGNAGLFERQDPERLREMIALNCTAPVLLTRALLPAMLGRRRGGIVIVGSVAGRQPVPLHAVYSATKGFDVLFGESIWVELRERGIDVVVSQPGPVATEFEAVAGERRPHPSEDEDPRETVRIALDALGRKPSVVSGTWLNWARANANRFLPRVVVAFVAGDFMARQVPRELREP